MLGCDIGVLFKVTIAGGSYQDGNTTHIQGIPPGVLITEEQIYSDLLLRKPGQDELTSPRREPDIPLIYSGINAADTMPGFSNKGLTNGTPMVILIPNMDRHFEHIDAYQKTNRTPRPGHASYASYQKYGECDDAIGAGIFSGRYTCTIVAAGVVAKEILKRHGIEVTGYIREAAGVRAQDMSIEMIREKVTNFREMRKKHDPVYDIMFGQGGRIRPEMRLLEKMAVLAEFEPKIPELYAQGKNMDEEAIRKEYGVHPKLNCPDIEAADEMYNRIMEITKSGDSSGGLVEVVATGLPAGMGEPVFRKLDGELGKMMSIAAVKAVEIGDGFKVKDMRGSECNDQMYGESETKPQARMPVSLSSDGEADDVFGSKKVCFKSNHAGGIVGGLTTGQPIVVGLAIKPTPTIGKPQSTIDKVSHETMILDAVTRRDPTIVPRVWPVAEAFVSIILLDHYMQHRAYQGM
ncbi:chorismate synthase [Candidatus Desantisbacteria bacterium]|nr:chorismate synthase [Candidatus Desantisbacteria bacterium]